MDYPDAIKSADGGGYRPIATMLCSTCPELLKVVGLSGYDGHFGITGAQPFALFVVNNHDDR